MQSCRFHLRVSYIPWLLLLVCSIHPGWSWGPQGHRIVAVLAEKHLAPQSLKRVHLLFNRNTSLADLADWADAIREERPETAAWHYINIPPTAMKLNLKQHCPDNQCVTFQARKAVATVRLGLRKAQERREAFKFLVHLMADLHQPLHAGHGQDRGGNEIKVVYKGKETNLHAFWDSVLLSELAENEAAFTARLAQAITNDKKKEWERGYLKDWTWESHLLAVRVAYGALPQGDPKQLTDSEYVNQATTVIEEQLAKAAVRLAYVIDDFWSH